MKDKYIISLFLILTCVLKSHSQEIDAKAECVNDLYKSKDTLTIVFRLSDCDSIFFYKIQVYYTSKGLFNKMYADIKLKQPKRCYDLSNHNIKKLNFKEMCTTSMPVIDYKTLSEYEKQIRNCKIGQQGKSLTIHIYTKNKVFKTKKSVMGIDLYNQIRNHIACLIIDNNGKASE